MTSAERKESQELLSVALLCLLWYATSSSSNVVAKALLSEFPYPMTVTMVQLTSISVLSGPAFRCWGVRRSSAGAIGWPYYFKLFVPLALGKFLGNVLSHVSIWKVPVSYAHTGSYRPRGRATPPPPRHVGRPPRGLPHWQVPAACWRLTTCATIDACRVAYLGESVAGVFSPSYARSVARRGGLLPGLRGSRRAGKSRLLAQ